MPSERPHANTHFVDRTSIARMHSYKRARPTRAGGGAEDEAARVLPYRRCLFSGAPISLYPSRCLFSRSLSPIRFAIAFQALCTAEFHPIRRVHPSSPHPPSSSHQPHFHFCTSFPPKLACPPPPPRSPPSPISPKPSLVPAPLSRLRGLFPVLSSSRHLA